MRGKGTNCHSPPDHQTMPLSLSIQSTPSRPIHGVQVVRPVHKVRLGVQRKDTLCIREEPQMPLDLHDGRHSVLSAVRLWGGTYEQHMGARTVLACVSKFIPIAGNSTCSTQAAHGTGMFRYRVCG